MTSDVEKEITEYFKDKDVLQYVLNDLDHWAIRDKTVKKCVFLTGVSTYLPEPLNQSIKGSSSIGKGFVSLESLRYFPPKDIEFLGSLSPKALAHEKGQLVDETGISLSPVPPPKPKKKDYANDDGVYQEALKTYEEVKAEWNERMINARRVVNLEHKLLMFLDAPDPDTFQMLLPILSHDRKEISYKYVDKQTGMTLHIVVRGYPSSIFCSSKSWQNNRYFEDFVTRCFTTQPEESSDKYERANELTDLKDAFPMIYREKTEEQKKIEKLLQIMIEKLYTETIEIVIPFTDLHKVFPHNIPRDMRDYKHFKQLIRSITAINFFKRPYAEGNGLKYIFSSLEDILSAVEIYKEIIETTRTGAENRLLRFYYEIVKHLKMSKKEYVNVDTARTIYYTTFKKSVSSATIRNELDKLEGINYLDKQQDPNDKRGNIFYPLKEISDDEIQKNTIKTEINIFSEANLENNLEETLKKYIKKGYLDITEKKLEQIKKNILYLTTPFFIYSSKPSNESKSEKSAENISKDKNIINFCNSDENKASEDVASVSSPKNVCDSCGKDSETELVDGQWLCTECKERYNEMKKCYYCNEKATTQLSDGTIVCDECADIVEVRPN